MLRYRALGVQIKLKRVEAGLFQRTMAAILGISQLHLSWWETGKYKPSAGYLRRLKQFLSLDPLALRVYVTGTGLEPRRRHGLIIKTSSEVLKMNLIRERPSRKVK